MSARTTLHVLTVAGGIALSALFGTVAGTALARTPPAAGWVEYAAVFPGGLVYSAKLDSGARTTSIHATGIRLFRVDDEEWVRFRLQADDGTKHTYELPVSRTSKTRDMTGPIIRRTVVRLNICVGGQSGEVEVNLSNRTGFNHGLLIGRNFLKTRYLIHTGERHIQKLACKAPETKR